VREANEHLNVNIAKNYSNYTMRNQELIKYIEVIINKLYPFIHKAVYHLNVVYGSLQGKIFSEMTAGGSQVVYFSSVYEH